MNVLLKIVQGPNAGAEIIIAEGMSISLGKGDSCDILLADQSLADVACELEVSEGRVRMLLPGGAEERLDPFQVRFLGETTAIAVGPEKGAWDDLAWPTRSVAAVAEDAPKTSTETPSGATGESEAGASPVTERKRKGCGCGCLMALIMLSPVVFIAAVFLLWPFRSRISGLLGPAADYVRPAAHVAHDACLAVKRLVSGVVGGSHSGRARVESVPRRMTIHQIAEEYGLECTDTNGTCRLYGNFRTRAQRLAAIAAAYDAKPGVVLDLSDDESLRNATSEVLDLVSEGKLNVHSATNRIVALSGFSPSASDLRMTLEAIRADVPNVKSVDCTRVRLGEPNGVAEVIGSEASDGTSVVKGVKAARVRRDKRKASAPKMPVVGVVTCPYPCLVLNDGSRVTEGAEFGGFIVEKIGADTIRVRGPEGTFEWRP